MGDQRYLCQLLQLQPWLLSRLSAGHCSFCQHHLHCLVTCRSGGRPPAASFLYQVHTRALMVLCKTSGVAPNIPSLIMIYCLFVFCIHYRQKGSKERKKTTTAVAEAFCFWFSITSLVTIMASGDVFCLPNFKVGKHKVKLQKCMFVAKKRFPKNSFGVFLIEDVSML